MTKKDRRAYICLAIATAATWLAVLTQDAHCAPPLTPTEARAAVAAKEAMCPLLLEEASIEEMIQLERTNPAGVVSLARLHELGGLLQGARAQIAEARKENARGLALLRRVLGRPLTATICEKLEE